MVRSMSVTVLTVVINIGLMGSWHGSSASPSTLPASPESAENSHRVTFYSQSLPDETARSAPRFQLNDDRLAEEMERWYLTQLERRVLGEIERGEIVPQDSADHSDYDQRLVSESLKKRFSEFLGGRRKRFSEFLGGKKRFSEFLGGKKRFSEFLGGKKRFSEFLGGK